jgi:hypothetical protein
MNKCAWAFAIVAAAAGCGDTCEERSGTYEAVYSERSGTCGRMPSETLYVHEQPASPPAPCTDGEIRYSDDNCEVTNVNVTCPEEGLSSDVLTTSGKYTWNEDGSAAFGSVTVTVRTLSGRVRCQSSYDVTVTRL